MWRTHPHSLPKIRDSPTHTTGRSCADIPRRKSLAKARSQSNLWQTSVCLQVLCFFISHFHFVTQKINTLHTSCGWSKTFWKSPKGDPENSPKIFLKSSSGSIDGPLLQYCRPVPAPAAPGSKLAVPYASYCFRFTSSLNTFGAKERGHQDTVQVPSDWTASTCRAAPLGRIQAYWRYRRKPTFSDLPVIRRAIPALGSMRITKKLLLPRYLSARRQENDKILPIYNKQG